MSHDALDTTRQHAYVSTPYRRLLVKIVVSLKQVADPDNANKVKVSPDGKAITTEGLQSKVNPFDEYALEAALRLNENAKTAESLGETIVVSIGPSESRQAIRQALAMGAARAVFVEADDSKLDSFVVARALKLVIEKEKPDVVLMGKQTVDSESGTVGSIVAELLGWPIVSFAMRVATTDGGKTLTVGRECDIGILTVKVQGPVILTVSDRILQPKAVSNGVTPPDHAYPESDSGRLPSLKGIMAAKKKPVEELVLSSLGIEAQPTTQYGNFALPPARSGQTKFVESVEDLVQKLRTEAKAL